MPVHTCLRRFSAWLLALGFAAHANAQDDCQLNVSEARLDFGSFSRAAKHPGAPQHMLGERRLSVTLNCPQPEDLSLFYMALAAGAERWQFTEHGNYQLQVSDGVLDGQAVELGLVPGLGQPPSTRGTSLIWRSDYGIAPLREGAVVSGKSLSVQLTVSAWADAAATHVRDAVTWEVAGMLHARHSGRYRELTLRARFVPVACTPHLSNGGVVDYGTLLAKDLSATSENPLPTKTLAFAVSCDAPTPFALRMHDNRDGSATGGTDETAYGLDLDASQNKIGRFYLSIDPADFTGDALPTLYRTDSTSGGVAWSSASARQIPMASHSILGFTHIAGSTAGPVAIQTLAGTVRIKAYIAPLQSLDLRNVVYINGSGTLEIIYL